VNVYWRQTTELSIISYYDWNYRKTDITEVRIYCDRV